jgi:uncharacterized protein YegP (UPF0339 family)
MNYRLHQYRDRRKGWRWTLYARNGRKVACSGESYRRAIDCARVAAKLFPWVINK